MLDRPNLKTLTSGQPIVHATDKLVSTITAARHWLLGVLTVPSAALDGETLATGTEPVGLSKSIEVTPRGATLAGNAATADSTSEVLSLLAAVQHTAELVERHEVVVDLTPTALEYLDAANDTVVDVCEVARDAWCYAHGVELLGTTTVVRRDQKGGNPTQLGISWEVPVGNAVIIPDHGIPGMLDSWTWNERVHFWRQLFGRWPSGRRGRLIAAAQDGLASVTEINPSGPYGVSRDQRATSDPLEQLAEHNAARLRSFDPPAMRRRHQLDGPRECDDSTPRNSP